MSLKHNHAHEVHQELVKLGFIQTDSRLVSSEQIVGGGSDTQIFELCFENPSAKFIQKIYREKRSIQDAEYEFNNQKVLFENNINVPHPYLLKPPPNTLEKIYFVMEKIEGPRFVEVKGRYPEKYEYLIGKMLTELYKIHSLDLKLFPTIKLLDINKNPYAAIDRNLKALKYYIERNPEALKELVPVYEWLEKNKSNYPCNKLVVVHGDYHSFNIIVQKNQDLKILDWNNIEFSDFRLDVCYTATIESYISADQSPEDRIEKTKLITRMYEQISRTKIEGLFYFMILACPFNLMRLYSMINDPGITGETEESINFFRSVKDYFLFLTYIIEKTCKIELKQIKEYFEEED